MNQESKPVSSRPQLPSKQVKNKAYSIGTIAAIATVSVLIPGFGNAVKATLQDSPKTVVDEAWQVVNSEFVDKDFNQINWQTKRQELLSRNYTSKEEAYKAVRQALKELGDPYTRFLDPSEFESLTRETSGEVSGVGIRLELDKKSSELKVVEPIANSPAIKAGIKAGDKIVKINGKPTSLMTLEQASSEIKGEIGTKVSLQISRQNKGIFDVALTRAQIELPAVTYNLKQEGQIKVGYIKLDEFSSHAAEQMKKAIEDLSKKKVSAYVLDLRGNPGGLLFASVDIARMWMKQGEIVHTIDRKQGEQKFSANNTALTDLPLAVLVNENSASASEILAGALKDNRRATVVGSRTYGKGLVQSVHTLSDGAGIAVTIARYYPPSGVDIDHKGIAPDIQLDLTKEQILSLQTNPSLLATRSDPQYARAIAILKDRGISQKSPTPQPMSIR
ncbi:MAG: carboxyl-terminal processing protease CtpB [Xenococcaceae cyanobacterium]